MPEILEAAQIPELLAPGMTVFCAGGMSHPEVLIDAINAHPQSTRGVRFVVTRPPGFRQVALVAPYGQVLGFFGGVGEGAQLLPMQYRRIYDFLAARSFDLALVGLGAASANRFHWGLGVDFAPAVLGRAKRVVVEVNAALPQVDADTGVDSAEIDAEVAVDRDPPTLEPRLDEVARRIGKRVAGLVDDGDCLQTGIGAIPDAVLAALSGHRNLGFHSGMLSNGVRDLVEVGALDGARKSRDRGLLVTGFVLGTAELYRWAARRDDVSLRPVSYTHDPETLASLDQLVSINSAVEVDLFGQVNSEMVRGRQVSGTGGAIDFCRGSARSRGGRSIVALPATAAGGKVSRIVPALGAGTVATLTRTDVDWVVTEHGASELRGRTVEERGRDLIRIAAPEHRESLKAAWEELAAR